MVKLAHREAATGQAPYGERMEIGTVAYGDVDRDCADETIAEIRCGFEGGSIQLIAFDAHAAT